MFLVFCFFLIGNVQKFKKINSQNILPFQDPNLSVKQLDNQTFNLTLFPGLDKALVLLFSRSPQPGADTRLMQMKC